MNIDQHPAIVAHSQNADGIGLGNDMRTPVHGASFDGVVGSNTSMDSDHLYENRETHHGSFLDLLEDTFGSDSGRLASGLSFSNGNPHLGPDVGTVALRRDGSSDKTEVELDRASSPSLIPTDFAQESVSRPLPPLPGPRISVPDARDIKAEDSSRTDFTESLTSPPLRPLPRPPRLPISVPDVSEVKERDGALLPSVSTASIEERRPPPPMRPPPPPPPMDTRDYDDSSRHSKEGSSSMAGSAKALVKKQSLSFLGKIKPKKSRSRLNDHGGDKERSLPAAGPSFAAGASARKPSDKSGASIGKSTRFYEDTRTGQIRSGNGIEGNDGTKQGNGSKKMSSLEGNGKEKNNNRGNEAKSSRGQTLKSGPGQAIDPRTSKLKPLLLGGSSSKEKTPAEDREAVKAALARNSSKANPGIPVRAKCEAVIDSRRYLPSDSLMRDQQNDTDDEDGDDSEDERGVRDAIAHAWHSITARKPKVESPEVKHSKTGPKGGVQKGGLQAGQLVYQPAQTKPGFFTNPFSKSKKEPVKTYGFRLRMPLEGSWIRDDPVGAPPPVPGTYAATATWTPDMVFGGRKGASSIEEIRSGSGPSILLPDSRMSSVEFMRPRPRSATSATSQNVQKSKSSPFLMVPDNNRSTGHARNSCRRHRQVKDSPTSAAVGAEVNTTSQTVTNSLAAPSRPTPNLLVQVPEITLTRPDQSQQQIDPDTATTQTRHRKRSKVQAEKQKGRDRSDKSEKRDRRPA